MLYYAFLGFVIQKNIENWKTTHFFIPMCLRASFSGARGMAGGAWECPLWRKDNGGSICSSTVSIFDDTVEQYRRYCWTGAPHIFELGWICLTKLFPGSCFQLFSYRKRAQKSLVKKFQPNLKIWLSSCSTVSPILFDSIVKTDAVGPQILPPMSAFIDGTSKNGQKTAKSETLLNGVY